MKARAIKNKPVPAAVDFGDGDVLNIVHNPAAFTPRLEMMISRPEQEQTTADMAMFLHLVLVSWDLEADAETVAELTADVGKERVKELGIKAGEVWPLSAEALCELPIKFLGQVIQRINQDNTPNANSSTRTENTEKAAVSTGSFSPVAVS